MDDLPDEAVVAGAKLLAQIFLHQASNLIYK